MRPWPRPEPRERAAPTPIWRRAEPPGNLPLQLNRFVGREPDVAHIRLVLESERLLTLTGTGGIGKTRLAIEVADSERERYRDGVWLIDLAPLAEPELVAQAVAAPLGVRAETGDSVQGPLLDFLRSRRLLLVIDNCEHLVDACARLVEAILRACPEVSIWRPAASRCTSRARPPGACPRWPSPRPCACSPIAPWLLQDWTSPAPAPPRSSACVSRSTVFRWPSSWPRRARACCPSIRSPRAWTIASVCWSAADARRQLASRRCGRPSTGATSYCPSPSGSCSTCLSVFAGGWTLEAAEFVGAAASDTRDRGRVRAIGASGRQVAGPGRPGYGRAPALSAARKRARICLRTPARKRHGGGNPAAPLHLLRTARRPGRNQRAMGHKWSGVVDATRSRADQCTRRAGLGTVRRWRSQGGSATGRPPGPLLVHARRPCRGAHLAHSRPRPRSRAGPVFGCGRRARVGVGHACGPAGWRTVAATTSGPHVRSIRRWPSLRAWTISAASAGACISSGTLPARSRSCLERPRTWRALSPRSAP